MSIQFDKVQPKTKEQLKQLINYAFKHDIYDLNFIDTSKITDMASMFYYCKKFDCDLSCWNVSNVTYMEYMFRLCKNFDCDLSNWDVSNVTNMNHMFYKCNVFIGKGLENWDVSKVKDMNYMFNGCDKMTIPSWYKLYHRK